MPSAWAASEREPDGIGGTAARGAVVIARSWPSSRFWLQPDHGARRPGHRRIAIAFAAQKTLENLFGGISVLADEVIRVGDYCRFGDRSGTVEDISLRSTRVRTDARTELSIPNGSSPP